jgi:hypothetical protein
MKKILSQDWQLPIVETQYYTRSFAVSIAVRSYDALPVQRNENFNFAASSDYADAKAASS